MERAVETLDYLEALYGKCQHGQIVLVGRSRNVVHGVYEVTDLANAAAHIERYPLDLFIKVNVMDHSKTLARNKYGIGGIAEVEAIVSFHLDVDVGEKNSEKYISRQQVLEILAQMPLLPSIVVFSNGEDGGLHVYWLFNEPIYIASESERERVEAIARRWRDELERRIKVVNPECGLDHGANIDRLLRPVGSTRTSGNRVSVHLWNTELRYTLEQFELPPLPGQSRDQSLSQAVTAKTEGEEVIDRYLDAIGMNTVEAVLFAQGYERCKGSDRFLIRPGSSSGSPTGEVFTLPDGRRGFTVKSGAADPLTSINRKGGNGNWYSVAALWLSFKYNVDAKSDKSVWKIAAKECHDFLRPPDVPGILEVNGMNQSAPVTSTPTPMPAGQTQLKTAEDRKNHFSKLGYAAPISFKEFMSNNYDVEFLVDNCVVKGSSLIIAGASKAMKTTISLQLAVALASGKPLFNKFHTRQCRVMVASAESGEAVLKRNLCGMAKALGVSLLDLQESGALHLQFWVPRLQDDDMMAYFADGIDACQPDVVLVDPLYLAMNGETQANLSLSGEQILKLTRLCIARGITPIVDDHVKRSSQNAKDHLPLQLEDITGAGKAEFFRQWFLVSRRSKFEDMHDSLTKEHDLWLTIGGCAGHRLYDGRRWLYDRYRVCVHSRVRQAVRAFGRQWRRSAAQAGHGAHHHNRLVHRVRGDSYHINWLPNAQVHLVELNSDHWKTWVQQRLKTPMSVVGAMTLFQASTAEHTAFAKHLTAEKKTEEFIAGKGVVAKWERTRKSNHWFDALSYACVAGHYCGVRLVQEEVKPKPVPKPREKKPSPYIDPERWRQANAWWRERRG